MRYSKTPGPTLFVLDRMPRPMRSSAARDLHGRLAIKAIEPSPGRTATLRIDILRDFEHKRVVTVTLLKW